MMPSRGLSHHLRAYATIMEAASEAKRVQAQATLAAVEASNGARVTWPLTDTFGRGHDYLRISLTERCNLRCTYCMPEEGVKLTPKEQLLTNTEILRVASLLAQHGVTKIRLTGGEPTLRHDLVGLVEHLANIESLQSIGITSNGLTLHRKLPELVRAGLTGVNLSLDTLDPFKFELMTKRRGHSAVLQSLDTALALLPPTGQTPRAKEHLHRVKMNTVVIRGVNDREIAKMAQLARDKPLDVRFIEYMPFDNNKWATKKLIPSEEILANLHAHTPALAPVNGKISDTARTFSAQGWAGTVSFISSMTDHFCAGCSRLRLGADGGFKVCLFGPPKLSLRPLLRSNASDDEIISAIGDAVKGKKHAHDGHASGSSTTPPEIRAKADRRLRTGSRPLIATSGHVPASRSVPPIALLVGMRKSRVARSGSTSMEKALGAISKLSLTGISRAYSTRITHLDESGRARMVNVGAKSISKRSASAVGVIWLNQAACTILSSSRHDTNLKGDALAAAQLAGIMAAKNTSALIPLCHPLLLDQIDVRLDLDIAEERVVVQATVSCEGKTGVEMEALSAVSVACLTLWDMLKSVAGESMRIGDIRVVKKSGGDSGDWQRED